MVTDTKLYELHTRRRLVEKLLDCYGNCDPDTTMVDETDYNFNQEAAENIRDMLQDTEDISRTLQKKSFRRKEIQERVESVQDLIQDDLLNLDLETSLEGSRDSRYARLWLVLSLIGGIAALVTMFLMT